MLQGFGTHWILSFHSCNVLRDCYRGVPRANKKWRPGYVKMAIFFAICGSNNLETVVGRRVHAARRFYRATLCKRGLCCHVVSVCSSVCLSVRPSVTFVDHVKRNKHILEFFSPLSSHTFLVWQNVLQYLNNFTKQHRARGLSAIAELLVWSRRENLMILHWDMAIYRFSKWRPSAILELFYHHTRPPTKSLSNFMSIWYTYLKI